MTITDLDKRVGIAIRHLRKICGLSQAELAEEVDVTQAFISMTEKGKRNKRLNLEMLQKVIAVFRVRERRFQDLKLSDLIKLAEESGDLDDTLNSAIGFCESKNDSG